MWALKCVLSQWLGPELINKNPDPAGIPPITIWPQDIKHLRTTVVGNLTKNEHVYFKELVP